MLNFNFLIIREKQSKIVREREREREREKEKEREIREEVHTNITSFDKAFLIDVFC